MIMVITIWALVASYCFFDFHVGNVESNCEQFENEADSDQEGKLTTSESYSKEIKQSN